MSEKPKRRIHLVYSIMLVIVVIYSLCSIIQTSLISNNLSVYSVNSYEEECKIITKTYAKYMASEIDKYIKQLALYTNQSICSTGTEDEIRDWFLQDGRTFRSKDFDYVAFVDSKGNFYGDNYTKTVVSDRDYFKAIMGEGKDTFVSSADASKITGGNIVHVCKAVNQGGKNIGFFTAVISVASFQKGIDGLKLGETGVAVIFAGDGSFVATSGNEDEMKTILSDSDTGVRTKFASVMSEIAQGQSGDFWFTYPATSKTIYHVYEGIQGSPWSIFFVVNKSQVYKVNGEIRNGLGVLCSISGIILLLAIFILLSRALKPLEVVNKNIQEIATGSADLTKRIDVKDRSEIGSVVEGFNIFTGKLYEIVLSLKDSKGVLSETGIKLNESATNTSSSITEITACIENLGSNINNQTQSVVETSTAINQISANIQSLNKMVVNQSANVTEASAAVTQMISNINSVNHSVERMAASFADLEKSSVEGVKKQGDVNERIRLIEEESQTLQEANTVISNIAEQTNLLAMNAAIEAAHAGESGKGFSVVADEIRKLSETSSEQSKTIGNQLQKIIESINGVVSASKDAQLSFSAVSSGISSTDGVVQEIKNAMYEQEEGSKQITIALNNMTDSTSEVTNASTEMTESAKAIIEEVKNLQENTSLMKQAMDEMSIGATKINETGSTLHDLTSLVSDSIKDIGEQVDKFIV